MAIRPRSAGRDELPVGSMPLPGRIMAMKRLGYLLVGLLLFALAALIALPIVQRAIH